MATNYMYVQCHVFLSGPNTRLNANRKAGIEHIYMYIYMYMYMLMRDEGRKNASKVIQTTNQSNTIHMI